VSRPDLIGTVLAGRYKIMGLIGEGGMGSVYLGEQIAMGRKTAIKVLHAGADDADAIARFRRGSRNAARIDHPNVCRVFEYGDPPGGLHFLAMEFIEGESIHDLLKWKDPIPLGRATRIIEQTVEALHAAHSLGIVHRDLKPANIMLTRGSRGEEIVKVVDFDIAKAPSDTDDEITQLDWMVGTPLYMSPEQFQAQALDKRSDIYSLAIVLFRMISGSFPFSDSASPWAIMAERMTSPPRPLSRAAPDMVFPPKLQEALDRALQLEPDERWPSVLEFGEALHEAVGAWVDEEEPLEEESPGTELLEKPWGGVSTLEESTPAASDSELESPHPAGADDDDDEVVDQRIPATEVGPKPPLPRTKEHPPKARGSSARRLRRATIAMTVTLAVGASAWGVYTALAGPPETPPPVAGGPRGEDPETAEQRLSESEQQFESAEPPSVVTRAEQNGTATPDGPDSPVGAVETPPPVAGGLSGEDPETAEQRLSGLEQQFESFAGDGVPVAIAEAADSVATRIYDQSSGIPERQEIQARAASVRAGARGYLDDLAGAVRWARQAVNLAPESQQYRTALTLAEAAFDESRLSEMQDEFDSYVLRTGVVPNAVAEAADSEAGLVFERNADRPALQARAAFVRAQALGVLDDWRGAVTWAQQAVDLAPGNQEYQRNLQDQRQILERIPGGTP